MNAGLLEDFVNGALHWELIFRNCRDLLLAESNEWILFEVCQELSTVSGSFFFLNHSSEVKLLLSHLCSSSYFRLLFLPAATTDRILQKKQSFPVLFQFFHIDGRFPGGFYSKFLGVFILKFETFKFKLFWRVHCKTLSKYKSRKKVRCHKRKRKEMDDLLPLIQHVCFQTLSGIPHPSKDASGSGCFPFVSLARPKRSLSGIKRDSTKHRFTLCLTVINCKYITLHSEIAIRKTQYLCGGTLHSLLLWPAKNTWID